jgi:hypothetical protein
VARVIVNWSEIAKKVQIQREGMCQCKCRCDRPAVTKWEDRFNTVSICQMCYDERVEFLPQTKLL